MHAGKREKKLNTQKKINRNKKITKNNSNNLRKLVHLFLSTSLPRYTGPQNANYLQKLKKKNIKHCGECIPWNEENKKSTFYLRPTENTQHRQRINGRIVEIFGEYCEKRNEMNKKSNIACIPTAFLVWKINATN